MDGNDGVCESCGRDEVRGHTDQPPAVHQSRHKRALWSKTKYRTNGITSVIWRLLFTEYPGIEVMIHKLQLRKSQSTEYKFNLYFL